MGHLNRSLVVVLMLIVLFTASAETLFQIKDESGNPVLVVSTDGLRILNGPDTLMVISSSEIKANIREGATKGLSRTFSISTTTSKGSLGNVLNVTTDGLDIVGQSASKLLGDTLMTISSKKINARIPPGGKALSRTFSVSTTTSKGSDTNVLEVGTESTQMRESSGNDYTNFSPENIFLGLNAGNSITDGKYNLFLGNKSGFNTTGDYNVQDPDVGHYNIFMGHESGYSNTYGKNNIYMGYQSGYENENGDNNVFLGYQSGLNCSESNNTFVGNMAGVSTTSGLSNSFFGCYAGYTNYLGYANTFIGERSGYSNYNGSSNTCLGLESGSREGGSGNTFIGVLAGKASYGTTTSDNVFVGLRAGYQNKGNRNVFLGVDAGSYVNDEFKSDRLMIANSYTATPLIYGHFPNSYLALNADSVKVKALVTGSGNAVYRNATTGLLVTSSSDIRLKENISPLTGGLEKILNLQGVTYSWKSDDNHAKKIGLIAQDVEKVLPELVFTNEADGYKGINYAEITAVLTEAVKEQQKIIEKLTERLKEVENKLNNK